MLRKLGQNCQIAIPKEIIQMLKLNINDYLDIHIDGNKIILEPQVLIPKDQAYFYTPEWQAQEKKADQDIKKKKTTKTKNIDALLDHLDD